MKRSALLCVAVLAVAAVAWFVVGCGDFAPTLPSPDGGGGSIDLYGEVLDDNFQPLPDTEVTVFETGTAGVAADGGKGVLRGQDITDLQGRYRIHGLGAARYRVYFSHVRYATEFRDITMANVSYELNLQFTGTGGGE